MTAERLQQEIGELTATFERVAVATNPSGHTLIRLDGIELPAGCVPAATQVLLVCNGQPRPQIYVKPGIKVPGGIDPRSTSPVQVEGEAWLQFSYSFPYDENTHTLVQFVGAALRRFAKSE